MPSKSIGLASPIPMRLPEGKLMEGEKSIRVERNSNVR
jgi:hypothetical protein